MDLSKTVEFLKDIHFYDVFLPFILVYTITYGVLIKTRIFKFKNSDDLEERENNLYSVISFVFGLLIVGSIKQVQIIDNIVTNSATFIIFIFVVILATSFVYGKNITDIFYTDKENKQYNKPLLYFFLSFVTIVIFFIAARAIDFWDYVEDFMDSFNGTGEFFVNLIIFIVFIGVIWTITNGGFKETSS